MKFIKIKPLFVFTILLLYSINSNAQTNIDSINLQLRALFGNLSKPSPPRLFNWDMAVHMADSSSFVPINYHDTLSVDNWMMMYSEMRNSAYDTIPIKTADSVLYPCYNYGADTVNMTTMFYDYYRFKPDALTTNIYFDFDTVNTILTDKPNRPDYPYDIFKVFASSPISNSASRSAIVFRFGAENMFFDNFNQLNANATLNGYDMRVNFNDSTGWHILNLGQTTYIPIFYTTAGKHPIEVMMTKPNGEFLDTLAYSISYINTKKTRAGPLDNPDQILNISGLNINVYEPCVDSPNHTKTLIYLEGIDLQDVTPFTNRTAQRVYEEQIIRSGLADLRNFGYRIFVVDWQNSRIDMRENADNLISFIQELKCGGTLIPFDNEEEYVIMGESMGGIVANFALMKMEQADFEHRCKPEKRHNTRLLVTLDSPFEGAHIPMSMQLVYRWARNHFGAALGGLATYGSPAGIIFGPIATKLLFKSYDLFLDGDAAKQLMLTHVSTQSLLGPVNYQAHNQRDNFIQDQQAMGDHPQFCKLVAASNGNMMDFGQTRYWDGQPRVAGDLLLRNQALTHGTILGQQFNFAGANLELHTDPDGNGNLAKLSFGTWFVKIKLKWWGIKFYTGFNSLCNKDWDGQMMPTSTSAGGMLDYNWVLEGGILANREYQGGGNYETISPQNWGTNSFTSTDGFHWNFVPVSSAFDNGVLLDAAYDNINLSQVFNMLPFHVFYGRPGNLMSAQPYSGNIWQLFQNNVTIRNDDHTDIRNDTLRDFVNLPAPFWKWYPSPCPIGGANMQRVVRMLNREMGDNEISLENRFLPWTATCSMNDAIRVNIKNENYEYPNTPTTVNTLPSVYSQDQPYIIGPNGFNSFFTTNGGMTYLPPFSGPYSEPIYTFQPCCENYGLPKTSITQPPSINFLTSNMNEMVIFPNPTTNDFVMKFVPINTGQLNYKITDMLGKVIYQNTEEIKSKTTNYFLPIQLPLTLASGQYLLQASLNEQFFSNKLIIQ